MVSCHADSSDGCHPGRKMRVWERELYVQFQDIRVSEWEAGFRGECGLLFELEPDYLLVKVL